MKTNNISISEFERIWNLWTELGQFFHCVSVPNWANSFSPQQEN